MILMVPFQLSIFSDSVITHAGLCPVTEHNALSIDCLEAAG